MSEQLLKNLIRDIPDFPKPGIIFKDITPVLLHPQAFTEVIQRMADFAREKKAEAIVGIESRGFMFGTPIALELGVGFIPVRKLGKLPHETIQCEYALEYGTNVVEMHRDAIVPGQRVVIVDDLLATGGTAAASVKLVEELGGKVAGLVFLVELTFLRGRDQLKGYDVKSFVTY
ncbi:MAG: adenine phosphoribosyltransferase [Armatimonadetes bacterium]|nr:adenine phosphoribosyltransferase [Armatimonadota bacterium]